MNLCNRLHADVTEEVVQRRKIEPFLLSFIHIPIREDLKYAILRGLKIRFWTTSCVSYEMISICREVIRVALRGVLMVVFRPGD